MKIKIFAFVMVLVLMCGMLVACKPDEGPDEPSKGGGGGDDIRPTDSWYDSIFWDEDSFIFKLTENSNKQELPSTCARYLAGDTDRGLLPGEVADDIDDMVDVRNSDAEFVTKVTPRYVYISDDTSHGWGRNVNDMVYDMSNFVPNQTPDAYCNFVYDMLIASLNGAFANLKSSSIATDGVKANYFRFTSPTFVDTGKGYMVEYMRSLSLSRNKQYCLSSDYFTDMVRAFFVVPVNVTLLQTIAPSTEHGKFNYDYDGDGLYELEDFYEYVYEYKWTYNTLAEISAAGFYDNTDAMDVYGNPNGDLNDRLIFAITDASGLSASGMLYTTSVTIIKRDKADLVDGEGVEYTDYVYEYPTDNPDLYEFCNNLTSLMSENKGVISITKDQCGDYSTDALLAIRNRFTNDRILFGGAICLGSLEYLDYREMENGFGVVPVPLFREKKGDAQEIYMTQIHNIGRIGAINAKTLKFAKISAYLDYQSVNSTEILNEYYNYKLSYDVAGGGDNVAMLNFIRSNVRTSFDKAFEDAIGRLFATDSSGNVNDGEGTSSEQQKWHALIMAEHFQLDGAGMAEAYAKYIESKGERLDILEKSYVGLPS